MADRYSYLACLSWAYGTGGGLLFVLRSAGQSRIAIAASVGASIAVIVLALLTWQQTAVWRDTGTLWSHVLKLDPNSSIAHYNLEKILAMDNGRQRWRIIERLYILVPVAHAETHNNLGFSACSRRTHRGVAQGI